ncbi:unnamed protein product [Anisakis simplex]|uniref:Ypsilon schachtel (inferred by orthology to a D. melanogaster protein) n=1 Tax=Anisakis simplex TaxID=6269 RepID=A0A0M3KCU5_ANISI|nr:unnamed protein product [Anisakis simplex]
MPHYTWYDSLSRGRMPYSQLRRILREESGCLKIVETGVSGYVRWYDVRKRYGFIERDDTGEDLFVHQSSIAQSAIRKPYLRSLAKDEDVEFDVAVGPRGYQAVNVTGPDGDDVLGDPIGALVLYKHRYGHCRYGRTFRSRYHKTSEHPVAVLVLDGTRCDMSSSRDSYRRGGGGRRRTTSSIARRRVAGSSAAGAGQINTPSAQGGGQMNTPSAGDNAEKSAARGNTNLIAPITTEPPPYSQIASSQSNQTPPSRPRSFCRIFCCC